MTSRGKGVLVLCTGNSCRSQMAEAFLRRYGAERVEAFSAGTEPAEEVHPLALRVMAEEGLDLAGQYPKSYRVYSPEAAIGTLITVCDGAAGSCPAVWPGVVERLHWPIEDPAAFVGDEEETLDKFRQVRDQLKARVREWLAKTAGG